MSTKTKELSAYAEAGRRMAANKAKAKSAAKAKPAEKKAEAPLAPFLRGDKRGLPMRPPVKEGGK